MWNFFKPRAAGVFGVTVYIIWNYLEKKFYVGKAVGQGDVWDEEGRNIGYLSDDLVYKGL